MSLQPPPENVWENGVGQGFQPATRSVAFSLGATDGLAVFGGREKHDLSLASLSYGYIPGRIRGPGCWYRGNWEWRVQLFGGAEFSPETEWLVGLTPHLRYDFCTGTRWIPFADIGAGVAATGIGAPDLSGPFEFNLQAGGGLHWFLKNDVALTLEAGLFHMSCAGIHKPNLGLNGLTGLVGVTCFF